MARFIHRWRVDPGRKPTTIKLYEARELAELEFFNIKLESHDVISAEGAPVEGPAASGRTRC
jgi:hypothetical protein